ncbi:hypothetical protein COP1_045610 [Malus domestica]
MSIQGPSRLDLELGFKGRLRLDLELCLKFLQGSSRLDLEGFDSRVVNRHVQLTTPSKSTQEFEGQNESFISDSFCRVDCACCLLLCLFLHADMVASRVL